MGGIVRVGVVGDQLADIDLISLHILPRFAPSVQDVLLFDLHVLHADHVQPGVHTFDMLVVLPRQFAACCLVDASHRAEQDGGLVLQWRVLGAPALREDGVSLQWGTII